MNPESPSIPTDCIWAVHSPALGSCFKFLTRDLLGWLYYFSHFMLVLGSLNAANSICQDVKHAPSGMSFLKHPDMSAKPKLPFILWFRKERELWLPSTSLWSQDLESAQNLYHMFDHSLHKLCSEHRPEMQPKQPRGAERWQEGEFPSKPGDGYKTAVTTCRKHWGPSIAVQKQTSWSLWSHISATDSFRTQRKADPSGILHLAVPPAAEQCQLVTSGSNKWEKTLHYILEVTWDPSVWFEDKFILCSG